MRLLINLTNDLASLDKLDYDYVTRRLTMIVAAILEVYSIYDTRFMVASTINQLALTSVAKYVNITPATETIVLAIQSQLMAIGIFTEPSSYPVYYDHIKQNSLVVLTTTPSLVN